MPRLTTLGRKNSTSSTSRPVTPEPCNESETVINQKYDDREQTVKGLTTLFNEQSTTSQRVAHLNAQVLEHSQTIDSVISKLEELQKTLDMILRG